MSEIDDLEEIHAQTSYGVNDKRLYIPIKCQKAFLNKVWNKPNIPERKDSE